MLCQREKNPSCPSRQLFLPEKGSLFYFGGFVIPNKVERDLVYFFTEVFRGTNDAANKDKFRKCQCFNYVYPTNDGEVSLGPHVQCFL